eukprot:10719147-Prorocentrum_lima.AAC.1
MATGSSQRLWPGRRRGLQARGGCCRGSPPGRSQPCRLPPWLPERVAARPNPAVVAPLKGGGRRCACVPPKGAEASEAAVSAAKTRLMVVGSWRGL